jgi:hypothetical protein
MTVFKSSVLLFSMAMRTGNGTLKTFWSRVAKEFEKKKKFTGKQHKTL